MADNPASAALAEIRERQKVIFDDPAGRGRPDLLLAVKAAREDIPRLLAALDAALAVHKPRPACGGTITVCGHDTDAGGGTLLVTWPCPTYKAILAALTGKEVPDA